MKGMNGMFKSETDTQISDLSLVLELWTLNFEH